MIKQNIAAYTETHIPVSGQLVGFVSINIENDQVSICVRDRAGQMVELPIPTQAFRKLARDCFSFACTTNA
jgi:hypothetical protein